MLESKDPAITLFGKKIPLPADEDAPAVSGDDLSEIEVMDEEEAEPEKVLIELWVREKKKIGEKK